MALKRLKGDRVWRFWLASPFAFEDWENPTMAEMNANPDNDPSGNIFNITCALNTDDTTFDLGDPETDDSLTFCQRAGTETVTGLTPEIVFGVENSTARWTTDDDTGLDIANLTLSLLRYRGVEYFAIMSVGKDPEEPVALGDRLKLARIETDWGVDEHGTGENVRLIQTPANRGDISWNTEVAA